MLFCLFTYFIYKCLRFPASLYVPVFCLHFSVPYSYFTLFIPSRYINEEGMNLIAPPSTYELANFTLHRSNLHATGGHSHNKDGELWKVYQWAEG